MVLTNIERIHSISVFKRSGSYVTSIGFPHDELPSNSFIFAIESLDRRE